MPAGLSVNPDTGAITGTPSQEQTANFSITIVDSTLKLTRAKAGGTTVHSTTQAFGITVTAVALNPPAAAPTPVPSLSVVGIVLLNLMAAVLIALGLHWRRRAANA